MVALRFTPIKVRMGSFENTSVAYVVVSHYNGITDSCFREKGEARCGHKDNDVLKFNANYLSLHLKWNVIE